MKDGAWAYRPAAKKNGLAVLASRPEEHKKVDRATRTLFALTDGVVRQHLTSKKTIGIPRHVPAGWNRRVRGRTDSDAGADVREADKRIPCHRI